MVNTQPRRRLRRHLSGHSEACQHLRITANLVGLTPETCGMIMWWPNGSGCFR